MKILKFGVFESSEVKLGFKYSLEYVKEALYYLTDIGFKVQKINSFYDNNRDFINAKKCFYSIKLTKSIKSTNISSIIGGYHSNNINYSTDVDFLSNIIEEIHDFCDKFESIYHNISYKEDFIEKKSIIKNKSELEIENSVWRFFRNLSYNKEGITPTLLSSQVDNLGEPFKNYYGDRVDGFMIKFLNLNGFSKSVQNTNIKRIHNYIDGSGWYLPRAFHTVDFRKVTEEDLKKLKSDITLEDLKSKFLGLHGVILEIDYNKWLKRIKKDWEENFEQKVSRPY